MIAIVGVFGVLISVYSNRTFAVNEENSGIFESDGAKHVTFYDNGERLTVKTDAKTVGEALSRAEYVINQGDIVEPGLDETINADNFFINVFRARPVIVKDGLNENT